MKKFVLIGAVACFGLFGVKASALEIGLTEGTRDLVFGTIQLAPEDTSSNPANAFNLDTLGSLDDTVFSIYGRIVDAVDNFAFGFTATKGVDISFIFDGYNLDNSGSMGAFVAESGFVSENGPVEKTATFKLLDAGNSFSVIEMLTLTTDITSGVPLLFSAGPGSYVLQIDGSGANAPGQGVGLYDIRVAAVPLPAALPLFLAALLGLRLVGRYRSRQTA